MGSNLGLLTQTLLVVRYASMQRRQLPNGNFMRKRGESKSEPDRKAAGRPELDIYWKIGSGEKKLILSL